MQLHFIMAPLNLMDSMFQPKLAHGLSGLFRRNTNTRISKYHFLPITTVEKQFLHNRKTKLKITQNYIAWALAFMIPCAIVLPRRLYKYLKTCSRKLNYLSDFANLPRNLSWIDSCWFDLHTPDCFEFFSFNIGKFIIAHEMSVA